MAEPAPMCECGHPKHFHFNSAWECDEADTCACYSFRRAPTDTDPVGRHGQHQGDQHWPDPALGAPAPAER